MYLTVSYSIILVCVVIMTNKRLDLASSQFAVGVYMNYVYTLYSMNIPVSTPSQGTAGPDEGKRGNCANNAGAALGLKKMRESSKFAPEPA